MKARRLQKTIIAVFCTVMIIVTSSLSVKAQNLYDYSITFIPVPYSDLYAVDGSGD